MKPGMQHITDHYRLLTTNMRALSDLSACIVTLVTLEAFLILVGLLVLDKSIALMKHSLTVTALPALLDVGMLLAQMHTWNVIWTRWGVMKNMNIPCTRGNGMQTSKINIVLPRSLLRAMTVSQCGQWNLATFSVCFCRMCIFIVPLWVNRAWQI